MKRVSVVFADPVHPVSKNNAAYSSVRAIKEIGKLHNEQSQAALAKRPVAFGTPVLSSPVVAKRRAG
jgi:hypothetical protein